MRRYGTHCLTPCLEEMKLKQQRHLRDCVKVGVSSLIRHCYWPLEISSIKQHLNAFTAAVRGDELLRQAAKTTLDMSYTQLAIYDCTFVIKLRLSNKLIVSYEFSVCPLFSVHDLKCKCYSNCKLGCVCAELCTAYQPQQALLEIVHN